jgi:serine phosphatase RsbU (regulator of sigma subunit)/anti-sigma regulatory factor (Ser/Thr protein kinase)
MSETSTAFSRPVILRRWLECDLPAVRAAVQTVHGFLSEQGWTADELMALDLALVEACNNAVRYADEAGRRHPIGLEVISEAGQVEFRVHDHTPGFEWPEKICLPAPESEGGRGLYLITTLMDFAGYFRGRNENTLVMRKVRPTQGRVMLTETPPGQEDSARKLAASEAVIGEMVEELSSCYESLSAIFRYSPEQGKTGSLKEFAQHLLGDLLRIVRADWFVLRLAAKGESRLVVLAASEPGLELEPLLLATAEGPSNAVEVEAFLTRQRIWFGHQRALGVADLPTRAKPDSAGVVLPVLLRDQLLGTLTIGKSAFSNPSPMPGGLTFTARQLNVISTFTDFLAIQIANARFQEEQFHRRLVTHELEIANNIQRSLLLTSLPQVPGFSLAGFCRSAHEVGGDFYDVLKINDHCLLLIIADVMGKGIPAAMFAAILRTLLRAAPELTRQPAALLARVNHLLFPELSGVDMFITAQLACIEADMRKIILASAGHCPLAVAGPAGVRTFSPEGMPLGIMPDTVFQEETVELPVNCRVLLYTDGLTEALDSRGHHFGQSRLLDWLGRSTRDRRSPEQLKTDLANELEKHQANTVLNDDQTFLIMSG